MSQKIGYRLGLFVPPAQHGSEPKIKCWFTVTRPRMPKFRGFSVVLQDVQNGTKTKRDVISRLCELSLEKAVVAEEQYNHQGR